MYLQSKVDNYYPGASIYEAMEIWSLPKNKRNQIEEICGNGEYFAQTKKDGNWYEYSKSTTGKGYLFSRGESVSTGLPVECIGKVPHIESIFNVLPKDTVLVGEIYYPNETTNAVRTIMGCGDAKAIERQKEKGNIHFYLHDILKYDGEELISLGAWDRYQKLIKVAQEFNLLEDESIEIAEVITENIYEFLVDNLAKGEEGSVLKKKDVGYAEGKRPAWSMIKWKKQDTVDVICIGLEDATKEYTGSEIETWQYWETPSGEKMCFNKKEVIDLEEFALNNIIPITKPYFFNWKTAIKIGVYYDDIIKPIGTVSSGLSDELKEDMTKNPEKYLGKVVECGCMEITPDALRHPYVIGFRNDKKAEKCTAKSIFR